MTEQDKLAIYSRLLDDMKPRDIADELEISYGTVLRHRNLFNEAKANNTLDKIIDFGPEILDKLDEIASNVPDAMKGAAKEQAREVKAEVTALQRLQGHMEGTATALVTKIKSRAMGELEIHEIDALCTALSTLQNAFFNKNTTQLNVQNNYGNNDDSGYSSLLSDKPAIDN